MLHLLFSSREQTDLWFLDDLIVLVVKGNEVQIMVQTVFQRPRSPGVLSRGAKYMRWCVPVEPSDYAIMQELVG